MDSFDVIVIGGGPAGATAALRARELGATVALVERRWMGGTCTNDGCVPTRVLAKTARLLRETEHFGSYGLKGARPTLDVGRLLSYTKRVVETIHEKKALVSGLNRAGVSILPDVGGSFVDSHSVALDDGRRLEGQKIIICAGGHARRFSFPGSEHVLTHHDVWSLERLPGSVAVVGAAATGCQLASILSAFGARVWLLEVAPRILAVEDPQVSQTVAEAFRGRGIEPITGIGGVERIEAAGSDGEQRVWYGRDGQFQDLSVEAVIFAVGWIGNLDELNLPAANVKTERNYVKVDDQLRTSVPHIYAAGDITGRMMLVQSANIEGRLAAENAVLGKARSYTHKIVPHGGFTDPEYGGVGLTEEQARAVESDCAVATVEYAHLDRAVIDGHTDGFCKLIVSRRTGNILGAHVVGEQAVEVIQMAAVGMATGMSVRELADLELAYPTYTDIIGMAARQLVGELG